MKITAWKCEITGQIFEDYRQYRRSRAATLREQKKRQVRQKKKQYYLDELRRLRYSCYTFTDIAQVIEQKCLFLWEAYKFLGHYDGPIDKITNVKFSGTFSMTTSNSHNAPVGKKTNWGGSILGPRGYPGFSGRLHYESDYKHDFWADTEMLKRFCIYTGSGNGGTNCNYDYVLFTEEWPHLNWKQSIKWQAPFLWDVL